VRGEFLHAWRGYEIYAWGHDELRPLSRTAHDWHAAPLLMTPVDALDTLLLMGLTEEAGKVRSLIIERLAFDQDASVKNFEVTIRLLGGLLSGHQMTGDARLLRLAEDLGTRLLPAFDSPTGMPYMYVNLRTGKTEESRSNPAEIGTLLLEFGTLASHVGGGIDSHYEYLLKAARLFGDRDCARMWRRSARALAQHLADEAPTGLWYGQVDMTTGARTATEFGALHAFLPRLLTLGGDLDRGRRLQDSWRIGISTWEFASDEGHPVNPRLDFG